MDVRYAMENNLPLIYLAEKWGISAPAVTYYMKDRFPIEVEVFRRECYARNRNRKVKPVSPYERYLRLVMHKLVLEKKIKKTHAAMFLGIALPTFTRWGHENIKFGLDDEIEDALDDVHSIETENP